jgi:hypothetical protein
VSSGAADFDKKAFYLVIGEDPNKPVGAFT